MTINPIKLQDLLLYKPWLTRPVLAIATVVIIYLLSHLLRSMWRPGVLPPASLKELGELSPQDDIENFESPNGLKLFNLIKLIAEGWNWATNEERELCKKYFFKRIMNTEIKVFHDDDLLFMLQYKDLFCSYIGKASKFTNEVFLLESCITYSRYGPARDACIKNICTFISQPEFLANKTAENREQRALILTLINITYLRGHISRNYSINTAQTFEMREEEIFTLYRKYHEVDKQADKSTWLPYDKKNFDTVSVNFNNNGWIRKLGRSLCFDDAKKIFKILKEEAFEWQGQLGGYHINDDLLLFPSKTFPPKADAGVGVEDAHLLFDYIDNIGKTWDSAEKQDKELLVKYFDLCIARAQQNKNHLSQRDLLLMHAHRSHHKMEAAILVLCWDYLGFGPSKRVLISNTIKFICNLPTGKTKNQDIRILLDNWDKLDNLDKKDIDLEDITPSGKTLGERMQNLRAYC